jgi:type IV secretion system protein VirB9
LLPPPTQLEPDDRPPEARVAAANAAATREPTRHGYLNAIQVHPYTPGGLYRLYTAPERISESYDRKWVTG